jgi:class 3 adenylate cyclase/predicted ATPase
MQPIVQWLEGLGFGQYGEAFVQAGIDHEVLEDLSEADLEKLGVVLGHRKKLLRAIAALAQPVTPPQPSAPAAREAAPIGREAERRQLTVMFCDLVGSTALSARLDPEDLRGIIGAYHRRCAEIIERAGGFVAKYMGDGVLAYFGYPVAHEDDAERAVRAGLDLILAVHGLNVGSPLQTRIGIATGLVVVGDVVGQGAAQEQAVVGETPNLAARLQVLAEPDVVVIDAATRRLTGRLFEYADLGAVELKGFAAPVAAARVLREGATESRFEALRAASTPFVGRDEELLLLERRWRHAKAGEGSVVLISGEPGIGKSRLAQTLIERIGPEPHTRLRLFCSPHHQDSALHPIIAQLERAAEFRRDDTAEQRLDKLEALLAQASNDLGEAAPLIAELLSIPGGERYPPLNLTPQKRKERMLQALLAQVEGLAARQPVLMLFEDAHWSDPTSLELLDLIVDRAPALPLLLIVTYRPSPAYGEFSPPWTGRPRVTLLSLDRLAPRERGEMIAGVTGGKALPKEIAEQIVARTDGVPLFVEELTKAVVESGIVTDAGDHYAAVGPAPALAIPATLHASLLARLDRLSPVREVAQIGAALGRQFSHELIGAVAGIPPRQLDEAMAQLVGAELIYRRGTPPDAEYTFKHALVQDAAYSTLLRSRRQQIHARIATTLEQQFPDILAAQPELLAHHFTEAALAERAIEYWTKAGQQALTRSAMKEAEALLRKGLSLACNVPDHVQRQENELDLLLPLGRAVLAVKGFGAPEAAEIFGRARELGELIRPNKLLPIVFGQWIYHLTRGDMDQAEQLAAEVRRMGDTRKDIVAQIAGCRASGTTYTYIGDFTAARDYLEQGLLLYDPTQRASQAELAPADTFVSLSAFLSLALACSGYPDQARSQRNALLAAARQLGHAFSLAYALNMVSQTVRILCAEPADQLLLADELLALSNQGGLSFYRACALEARGWCLSAMGQSNEGIQLITNGLAAMRATGTTLNTPGILTRLADAYRLAGQPDTALTNVAEAAHFAETTRTQWGHAETLRLRGDLLILTGDHPAAEVSYRDAITLARRQGAKLLELRASTSLARLWRDQDKAREAYALLAPIYGWFTEGFNTAVLKEARALLDELGERVRRRAPGEIPPLSDSASSG